MATPKAGWKKGQSGNPKGRPAGVGQIGRFRAAIADRVPDIIDGLITRAIAGDTGAARLLIERVVPPLRPAEQTQALALPNGASLTEQGRAVVSAMARGELAPGQGAQIITALAALARVTELDEIEQRLTALEKGHQ
jgi:hypothetical protein